ncbi:putative NIT2-nitrilase [Ceraceosorus guamensis]|uniref:Putative NIT2-nitrilase n=1 Tax=Ceraceosorus guamensis TaxID=1522189 RepID=A0A316VZ17_9BASI|nr:putative NIT2-nitrilase [Ceraceosorus guamensis]PWN42692.1 putative NIT2-nitrilase [Ceraceosorus guamensis]
MVLAAVAQLTSTGVIADNLAVASGLVKRAAASGARALFLPEATDFIAPSPSVGALTRSAQARSFVPYLCKEAKQSNIWVSVGVHEAPAEELGDKERCYNTQVLIDNEGKVRESYRKLHLFDVDIKGGLTILESNTTIPGKAIPRVHPSPIGALGLQTCYDIRFPESSLSLRRQGAQILTFPSAFTVRTGAAHWEVLLRARALDTQSYVLAAAQVGAHEGTKRVSYGHAMIVDPWGSIVAQCSDMQPYKPTLCFANIDLDALTSMRTEMPLWDQRRTDVYPEL